MVSITGLQASKPAGPTEQPKNTLIIISCKISALTFNAYPLAGLPACLLVS